jgi:hypothetical protein
MSSKCIKLSNNLEVTVRLECKNELDPKFRVNVNDGDSLMIEKGVLCGASPEKRLLKILNSKFVYSFSMEDVKMIYGVMKDMVETGDFVDISNELNCKETVRELFNLFKEEVEIYKIPNGAFCTRCYIRKKDGDVYFCIPSKGLKELLKKVGSSFSVGAKFRDEVDHRFELWTGSDKKVHRCEYHCTSKGEDWSLRIKMDAPFFSKEEIEFARGVISSTPVLKEVA